MENRIHCPRCQDQKMLKSAAKAGPKHFHIPLSSLCYTASLVLRIMVALIRLLGEQHHLDVGQDTALHNPHFAQQLVEPAAGGAGWPASSRISAGLQVLQHGT